MSLKAHAPRRPEHFRPDLAALAKRANLARRKARPRTRLGFHNRLELSKSHFAAVHESGIRTFETCRRTVTMSVIGVERKLSYAAKPTRLTLNGHPSNRPPSYFWMANGATFRPSYIPSAPPPENYRPNCVRIQSYLAPGPTLRGVCSLGSVSRRAPSDIRPVSEAIAELKATAVHQLQRRHLATATSLIPHDLPNHHDRRSRLRRKLCRGQSRFAGDVTEFRTSGWNGGYGRLTPDS
jgi:hypothetical protein